ncbi:AAA family ATPase [Actinoplanes missouriensis]|uniref:AAA family ATPase n=1 Tax=Actinoplanes missouriensis TaxID=1866 RepID=UPI003410819D
MRSDREAIVRLGLKGAELGLSEEKLTSIEHRARALADSFAAIEHDDPIVWLGTQPHRFYSAMSAKAQAQDRETRSELWDSDLYAVLDKYDYPVSLSIRDQAGEAVLRQAYLDVARAAAEVRTPPAGRDIARRHLAILEELLSPSGFRRWWTGTGSVPPHGDPLVDAVEDHVFSEMVDLDMEASQIVAEFAVAMMGGRGDAKGGYETWRMSLSEGLDLYISFLAGGIDVTLPRDTIVELLGDYNTMPVLLTGMVEWQMARMWKFRPPHYLRFLASRTDRPAFAAELIGHYCDAAATMARQMQGRLTAEHGHAAAADVPHYLAQLDRWRACPDEASLVRLGYYVPDVSAFEVPEPPAARATMAVPPPRPDWDAPTPKPDRSPLDPETSLAAALDDLDGLVGLDTVKADLRRIVDYVTVQRRRAAAGMPVTPVTHHLVFVGNPGTGKTTVARIAGRLFAALGLLSSGHCVEASRADLVAEYVGQTAQRTGEVIERARGGVLIIDEAYSLAPNDRHSDYGSEAIETLLLAMENHRDDLVVIVAGYPVEMERFIASNPGLRSRFPRTVAFADYSAAELLEIFDTLAGAEGYTLEPQARSRVAAVLDHIRRAPEAGNARAARNLFDDVRMRHAERVATHPDASLSSIVAEDIPHTGPRSAAPTAALETLLGQLDGLVGMDAVKQDLRGMTAVARMQRLRAEQGLPVSRINAHVALLGGPGTGKTTVARLLGGIYQALGILPSGHLVEVGRADLVGSAVGQTAPLVKTTVQKALGGVLFVDEPYALLTGGAGDYGREAMETLVTLLDAHNGDFVCVLAGHPERTHALFEGYPALRALVPKTLMLPDFTDGQLRDIFVATAAENGFVLDPGAGERAAAVLSVMRGTSGFANARTARQLFDATITRQAIRLAGAPTMPDPTELSTVTIADIGW